MKNIQIIEGEFSYDLIENKAKLTYGKSESYEIKQKYQDSKNICCDHTKNYIICGVDSSTNSSEEYSSLIFIVKQGVRIVHQNEYSLSDDEFPPLNPANSFVIENYEDDVITYIKPKDRNFVTLKLESSLIIWALIIFSGIILITLLTCMAKLCQEKLKKRNERKIALKLMSSEGYHKTDDSGQNQKGSFSDVLEGITKAIDEDKKLVKDEDEEEKVIENEIKKVRDSDEVDDVEIY